MATLQMRRTMTTITACGSGKYRRQIHAVCRALSDAGFLVLVPPLHAIDQLMDGTEDEAKQLAWKGATFAHLERVRKCDVCLILNFEGYLGVSSTLELGYACALGKVVVALGHDTELARNGIFDFILETEEPKQIAERIEELLKGISRYAP